jgi:hypothetical protein
LQGFLHADNATRAKRATHAVYGSMIVLAAITGLDEASATANECLVAVIGIAFAVGVSEVYADVVGSTFRHGRAPTGEERIEIAVDVTFGFAAALSPAIFFLLARFGVISVGHALNVAEWAGVGVLWFYVFAAARAAGLRLPRAIAWSILLTVCGVVIVQLKLIFGH